MQIKIDSTATDITVIIPMSVLTAYVPQLSSLMAMIDGLGILTGGTTPVVTGGVKIPLIGDLLAELKKVIP
jgi:hypothetical protein